MPDGSGGAGGSSGAAGASGGPGSGDGGYVYTPPPGFTRANLGSYRLGRLIQGPDGGGIGDAGPEADGGPRKECTSLIGVIRDFGGFEDPGGHIDFENVSGTVDQNIVTNMLGAGSKPVYANPTGTSPSTHGQQFFDQWYRDMPGVNVSYELHLDFEPTDPAREVFSFHSSSFFPLDGQGFGNQGRAHNFHFTTEIHTRFTYNGGEVFTFTGDDDVFLYLNGIKAVDLGGIHAAQTATVNLDQQAGALGLTLGRVHTLDVFQAERHTNHSNYRIDTSIVFECID